MPFNKNISGIQNEIEFVYYLNKKKVKELSPIWQDLLHALYPSIHGEEMVYSWKNKKREKTDIFIEVDREIKNISIKKGVKNSVHVEPLSTFMKFLKENGISQNGYFTYLYYHFADGTANGTGKIRKSAEEYKQKHQRRIDSLNKEWNTDYLLSLITERFLLGNGETQKVDAIVYGVTDDFLWVLKEDIKEIVLSKKEEYSTGPHFGPLSCQPMTRCLNYNEKYERNRFFIQIKWYNLADDIIQKMNEKIWST